MPRTPAQPPSRKQQSRASVADAARHVEEALGVRAAGAFDPIERLSFAASAEASSSSSWGPRLAVINPQATGSAKLPPVSEIRRFNASRLLPSKYSESVLTRIADNQDDLALIFALDNATNDRLLAEGNLRLGITARELVFNVPNYRIINAAFCHPHPQGGRFSLPYRGAWYAAFELATAKAEVLFHRALHFHEISWNQPEELDYDQYFADFCGSFHDLRPQGTEASPQTETSSGTEPSAVLSPPDLLDRSVLSDPSVLSEPSNPSVSSDSSPGAGSTAERPGKDSRIALRSVAASEKALSEQAALHAHTAGIAPRLQATVAPVGDFGPCLEPRSYVASQQLTLELLETGSPGILYPSTRRPGGSCIACFRPSLVCNVRKRDLFRLTWYPDRPATFLRCERPPVAAV